MTTVVDVARFILRRCGPMTAMKLQKLVYYAQAWNLVWDEEPLFHARIEAWANGPVVRDLYDEHRGKFRVTEEDFPSGNPEALNASQKDTVEQVIAFYGQHNAQWLSDLTHMEEPWKLARGDLPAGASCNREITHAQMHEFYSGL
ncbi:Panacea domain-containing protein [Algiphilus aromaticivorans]|uniref:Panacea domain-containing protein n=1 Tax=Algiphilus aromaticivorans TaxID=382454 RepID=UPI0005C21DA4|nr:type II toxin-antitoxin system antitoxin SocA domain-containing protein [Algiphilus aromaticivorans]